MSRKLWLSLSLVVILAMLSAGLAGCGPTPAPQIIEKTVVVTQKETVVVTEKQEVEVTKVVTEQVEKVVTATPEPVKKILTFAWTQEPDTLNPYYTNMWFSTVLQELYNCWAWAFDDQNKPFPRLVTELPTMDNGGLSADGLVLTLKLRDDIVWSDGTPITSADFVFTYDMIVNTANTVSSMYPYDKVASMEAPDDRTVVMTFPEPYAAWQSALWKGLMPKHILQPVFDAEGTIDEAEWNRAPTVGCGPYVVDTWESGSFIHFVKNPNYWLGEPKIEEVYFQFVPDDATQTAKLIAGEADLGTFPPLSDVPALQAGGLEIQTINSGYAEGWYFRFIDPAHPGAADLKVRQAVAQAVDREAIAQDLLLGLTEPANTLWDALAGQGYVSPDIVPWTFDPGAAKALLEEAGWTDTNGDGIREDKSGNKLTLSLGTTQREIRQDIQAVVQNMLRDVGIELEIPAYDSDLFFASYADGSPCALGELDIMEWSDCTGDFPDPDHYYWNCSEVPDDENPWGANYFGCDEYLDGLFQQQITMIDAEARKAVIQEITKYMHDNVYWYGLYVDPDYWVVAKRVTGAKFSGITPLYSILEWDIQ